MADKTSDSGIWLTDDGKVVKKKPEGGATQLVRPGGRITEAVQARIDSLDADPDAPAVPAHEALGNPVEVNTEDSGSIETAVTTDAAKPVKKAARKSK